MDISDVRRDLLAEQDALDAALRDCGPEVWARPTASPRWSVADQIAHLAFFDHAAMIAISRPDEFPEMVRALWAVASDGGEEALDDHTLGRYRSLDASELLAAWRADRAGLADASATLGNTTRVDWFGPQMGSKSFLTARLMECWAHGVDATRAAGVEMAVTDRLQHIARLGAITRGWSYVNRGLDAPTSTIRIDLTAPSGASWRFGDDDGEETVTGSAHDFCLVVTQRIHLDDTELDVSPGAREWLLIAQAFAGGPTNGPAAS